MQDRCYINVKRLQRIFMNLVCDWSCNAGIPQCFGFVNALNSPGVGKQLLSFAPAGNFSQNCVSFCLSWSNSFSVSDKCRYEQTWCCVGRFLSLISWINFSISSYTELFGLKFSTRFGNTKSSVVAMPAKNIHGHLPSYHFISNTIKHCALKWLKKRSLYYLRNPVTN